MSANDEYTGEEIVNDQDVPETLGTLNDDNVKEGDASDSAAANPISQQEMSDDIDSSNIVEGKRSTRGDPSQALKDEESLDAAVEQTS